MRRWLLLAVLALSTTADARRDRTVTGDVIKAAVAYFLGVPLDLFQRIEIGLASVSVIAIADYGPWVLCVNNTGDVALPDG